MDIFKWCYSMAVLLYKCRVKTIAAYCSEFCTCSFTATSIMLLRCSLFSFFFSFPFWWLRWSQKLEWHRLRSVTVIPLTEPIIQMSFLIIFCWWTQVENGNKTWKGYFTIWRSVIIEYSLTITHPWPLFIVQCACAPNGW